MGIALAVLAAASACSASPEMGNCKLLSTAGDRGAALKSCSNCQWDCLTDPLHCTGLEFDDQELSFDELFTWKCGDGNWEDPAKSAGLCVLFDTSGEGSVFDTQEQGCQEW